MTLRIAINGFGRIGRCGLRALYESNQREQLQIVAINEPADPHAIAHLLQYDSTHGKFYLPISSRGNTLLVGSDQIALTNKRALSELDWRAHDVDVVLDCTGVYGSREHGELHLNAGAKKVLFSHPGAADLDKTIIYGINHHTLTASDKLVSNGSCTTNCIVPVLKVLHDAFSIQSGSITTIHSAMNDQQVTDSYCRDLYHARAASNAIVPVNTQLHLGITRIFPFFANKFEAISVRVPTINVTAMDLCVYVHKSATIYDINKALKDAAATTLRGIMAYNEQPLVSIDFNHDPHSAIVDGTQTRVSDGHLVKLLVWCDNEWGFANRMLDTAKALASA